MRVGVALLVVLAAAVLLRPAPTGSFGWSGLRWPTPEATQYVGLAPPFDESYEGAMQDWTDGTGFEFSIVKEYRDPCESGFGNSTENGVEFSDKACGMEWPSGTLAMTFRHPSIGIAVLTGTGVVFNDNLDWGFYNGPPDPELIDFRRVAFHELGHVIGLEHEGSADAVMHPSSTLFEVLQVDDYAGVVTIYPDIDNPPPPPSPDAKPPPPPLDPRVACAKQHLLAAGKLCNKAIKCQAKDWIRGPDPPALLKCVEKAEVRFVDVYSAAVERAVDRGDSCKLDDDPGDVLSNLDSMMAVVVDRVTDSGNRGDESEAKLVGRLLKDSARYCGKISRIESKDAVRGNESVRVKRRQKARAGFEKKFSKKVDKGADAGVVYNGRPVNEVGDAVDTFADVFAAQAVD